MKKVAKQVAREMENRQIEHRTDRDRRVEEKPERVQASVSLELADVEDICIIQAGDESELIVYQGFWREVIEVREVTCTVEVYDRILDLVRVENLEKVEVNAEDKNRVLCLSPTLLIHEIYLS